MILSVQLMLSTAHMALSFVAPPSSPEYETSALGRSLNLIERLHSFGADKDLFFSRGDLESGGGVQCCHTSSHLSEA